MQLLRLVRVGGWLGALAGLACGLAQPGCLDPTFKSSANDIVYALAALPDGKVLVGGAFNGIGGVVQPFLARLRPDGSVDTDFQAALPAFTPGNGPVTAIAVQSDGRILIAGQLNAFIGDFGAAVPMHSVARLSPDGRFDTNFVAAPSIAYFPSGVAGLDDGRVFVTAYETGYASLVRLGVDGALDEAFTAAAGALGFGGLAVAGLPDGGCVVGGMFGLARLDVAGNADPRFQANADGPVAALTPTKAGRWIVAGDFQNVGGRQRVRVARLNANGSADPTFDPGVGPDAWVSAVAVAADGKVVIGGQFATVGGESRKGIARLKSDGTLDAAFDSGRGTSAEVRAVALGPGGETVIGGLFTQVDGQTWGHLARLTGDGSANPGYLEFNPQDYQALEDADPVRVQLRRFAGASGAVSVTVTAMQGSADPWADFLFPGTVVSFADGETAKEVAVGLVADNAVEDTEVFSLVLSDPTGGVTVADASVARVYILNDDAAVGTAVSNLEVSELAGTVQVSVNRYGADFRSFTVDYAAEPMTAQAGFDFLPVAGQLRFEPGQDQQLITIPVLDNSISDGERLFGVRLFDPSAPVSLRTPSSVTVRLRDNEQPGGMDPAFRPAVAGALTSAVRWPDGRSLVLTNRSSRATAFLPSGIVDTDFTLARTNLTALLAVDRANRLLAITTNGMPYSTNRLVRFLPEGSVDPTFNSQAHTGVRGVERALVLPDGRIVLCGSFYQVNGVARNTTAWLLENGLLDTSWPARFGDSGTVHALALEADGSLLLAGKFSTVNSFNHRGLARVRPGDTLDPDFLSLLNEGTTQEVWALAVEPDGHILVGGAFTSFSNQARSHLVRLDAQGKLDLSFGASGTLLTAKQALPRITAIRLQPDGRIIVAGAFSAVRGIPRAGLARFRPDGALDETFDPGAIVNNSTPADITFLELTAEGILYVGGQFTSVAGVPQRHLVRLHTTVPPLIQVKTFDWLGAQFRVHFYTTRPGRFALEKTDDWRSWTRIAVGPELTKDGYLIDPAPPAGQRYYRVVGPIP